MHKSIEVDAIKIGYDEKKHWLTAKLPNGDPLPFITKITIVSEVGSMVKAQIEVLADATDLEKQFESDYIICRKIAVKQ